MFFRPKKINEQTLEKFRHTWTEKPPRWLALEMNHRAEQLTHNQESYALELHHSSFVHRLEWQLSLNKDNDTEWLKLKAAALLKNKKFMEGELSSKEALWSENFGPTLEGSYHFFFKEVREQLVTCGKRT